MFLMDENLSVVDSMSIKANRYRSGASEMYQMIWTNQNLYWSEFPVITMMCVPIRWQVQCAS